MTEEAAVKITLPTIYGEMVAMKDDFAEVKGMLREHIALEQQRSEGVEVRLENHGTRLSDQGTQITSLEGRVTQHESDIRLLKELQAAREAKKAPWWSTVSAVVGIVSGVSLLVGLFLTMSKLAEILGAIP